MADDTTGTTDSGDGKGTVQNPPEPNSLDTLLSGLDENTRRAVQGIVSGARSEAGNYRTQLRDAQSKATKYDEMVAAQATDQEKAQKAQKDAEDRATAATARAVKSEVKALAADTFADPADAHVFLGDLTGYLDDKGEIDAKRIKSDLEDLVKSKPYLAKTPDNSPRTARPDKSQASGANGQTAANTNADKLAEFINRQLGR